MPSDERWRNIVDAAAVVFQKKGYEAATTADIAEAVGMLKGSLYYYIRKKEDLLFAVIQDVHEAFLVNHVYCRRIEGDVLTRMRAFIEGHVAVNAREAVRSAVFYRDFHALSPDRQAVIISERDRYDQFLRELIREGQEDGTFCPDLDPKVTSIGVLAMMNHVFEWYRPDGPLTPEEVGQRYADLLLGGLLCPGGSHSPGHRSELGRLGAREILMASGGRPVSRRRR
jgi:AcrR family transcriptional regulator